LRFTGICYRAIDPRWSFAPLSGEGAAIRGARFNPKGVPALYLATTTGGAIAEATQGFAYKFNPLTLCSYEVDCSDILDLSTDEARAAADVSLDVMACPWAQTLAEHKKPRSWTLYSRFKSKSAGLLVPSFANRAPDGAKNLVLWRSGDGLAHKVEVFDPEGRLAGEAK
jgi:RES domain-containing protein